MTPRIHVIAANNLADALAKIAAITQEQEQAALSKESIGQPTSEANIIQFFGRETNLMTRAVIETTYHNLPEGVSYETVRAEVRAIDYPTEDAFIEAVGDVVFQQGNKPGIKYGRCFAEKQLEPLPQDNN